ncbi:MAG: TldD/PmbA family protein [Bdellovibrionales bacterium]|nr:TldD/PmbA family protein [Bdellovibrionales bacterium]
MPTMNSEKTNRSQKRAGLSSDLETLRPKLLDVLGTLEANPEWYASVFFERKANQTFMANLKQTQLSDSVSAGAVLRIYDGYTLFEQATDQTDPASLLKEAKDLVARVKKSTPSGEKRIYKAPTWAERLATKTGKLDPELLEQIPAGASAKTPVHFGIAFREDPTAIPTDVRIGKLKETLERVKRLAPKASLTEKDLSYIAARQAIAVEESIFVDRESNLSQTLYRVSLTLILMSGAERAAARFGGLGGAEAAEVKDEKIVEMLEDLRCLKEAERLKPGKYTLLLGPTLSGVLAHEAFGHSQEADTCARGRSKAWELHKEGSKVGNDLATILNSPAVYKNATEEAAAWGSYFFDEEGWLAQEQVILDKGVLKPPMTNLTSALRLGIPRSSNGKRESWQNGVYTRQTNTYFSAGDKTFDELLGMIDYGFVAMNAAGGMEDPKGMGIQVGVQYLKEVKDGKYTGKVFKGPAGGDIQITGYVPDVLNSIVAKSKIEADKSGADTVKHPFNDCGGCGKYHKEIVYAGCGGPHMLLKDQILG